MKSIFKYILIVFVILLGLSGLFALFERPDQTKENISLSRVVAKINNGEAKEIVVKGDILEIKTAPSSAEATEGKEGKTYKSKTNHHLKISKNIF